MSLHIETIPDRGSLPAVPIGKAWREDGRLRKKTVGNIARLPTHIISGMKALFKGGIAVSSPEELLTIRRSLPHGHVSPRSRPASPNLPRPEPCPRRRRPAASERCSGWGMSPATRCPAGCLGASRGSNKVWLGGI